MDLIYLDYNCFQRLFDDPRQIRIQMEALACLEIFALAEKGRARLIWSFMHADETILCPFPERRYEILRLSSLCKVLIGPEKEIQELARILQRKGRLSAKDAVHLACALYVRARYFLTCDDRLINQAKRLELETKVMNPVYYIQQRESK